MKYYENLIVIGDLNYDMLWTEKSQTLDVLCDLFDLTNIIKKPTCFKKDCMLYLPTKVNLVLSH